MFRHTVCLALALIVRFYVRRKTRKLEKQQKETMALVGGITEAFAQIIAVADCFDAMYSNRPYRNRMNFDKVASIIKEVSGTQLMQDVVDAFLRLVDKGEFRDPDDMGGGSMENIENIRSEKP